MVKTLEEMISYYQPAVDKEATIAKVKRFWQVLFPELLDQACISKSDFVLLGSQGVSGVARQCRNGKSLEALNTLYGVSHAMLKTDAKNLIYKRFVNHEPIESFMFSNEISKGKYYVLERSAFYDFANCLRLEKNCPDLIVSKPKKSEK